MSGEGARRYGGRFNRDAALRALRRLGAPLHARKEANSGFDATGRGPYDGDVGTLIDLAPLAVLLAAFACWLDVGTLIDLAPLAVLLAAFAYWIDRQLGRRFDDLGQRLDDLKSEFRAAHERTLKRFDAIVPHASADRRTGP